MSFTLLTHNAFWFQGMPFEGTAPGAARPEIMRGLARLYAELGANVLCVQEIQSPETAAALADALGLRFAYLPGRTYPVYGGAVFFREGETADTDRAHGFAVERFWLTLRVPVVETEEILVANVHLPSGRQSSKEDAERARVAELEALLAAGPAPAILCGDLNEMPGGGVQRRLEAAGYRDLAPAFGFGETDSHTRRRARRIDYIWAREDWAARAKRMRVLEPAALALPDGRYVSDHLPLLAEFA
ncbi:MAG: endonuclease/exonuclease/phosphatase family protein [Planctomycetota bacterium]|nr:endonuclease/exonuclease/phosphatase family protein [Planctomycetota bacterium]